MTEIKIAVSDRTNKIIQDIAEDIGIKKSEFVKNVVVENLKKLRGTISTASKDAVGHKR